MPLLKKIVKADHREVVVKWTGSGSDTLLLTDLVVTGQTVIGNKAVDIVAVSVSSAGATTITRNSEVTFALDGPFDYYFDDFHGVVKENNQSDIVVNLATTGTLLIRLNKAQGYSQPTL